MIEMPQQNNTPTPPPIPGSASKQSSRIHVLPEQIPDSVGHVLRQTLKPDSLVSAFKWMIGRIPETANPTELADHLSERYDQQIIRLKGGAYKEYLPVFQVGFAAQCLEILPLFSMKMAQAGYNPVFLRIYFQKRLLASLIGITITDIERRARSSNLKMAEYLTDQIHRVYPNCCVARELKLKL